MLSEKGQSILANQADIPSIRNDIEGKNDIDGMTKMLGNALKPIPVDGAPFYFVRHRVAVLPWAGSIRPNAGAGRPGRQHGSGHLPVSVDQ